VTAFVVSATGASFVDGSRWLLLCLQEFPPGARATGP